MPSRRSARTPTGSRTTSPAATPASSRTAEPASPTSAAPGRDPPIEGRRIVLLGGARPAAKVASATRSKHMGVLDILQQYPRDPMAAPDTNVHADFDEVAREAPTRDLGDGIAAAFRSDATPPFGQMVGN